MKKYLKGQTLTETLIALAIAMVIITFSTTTVVVSLKNAQSSKYQNQASKYAQEAIEIARQIRDSSWNSFDQLSGGYCMAVACTTIDNVPDVCGVKVGSCGQNVHNFSREINITRNSSDCNVNGNIGALRANKVIATVSWTDSSCVGGSFCRQVSTVSCLGNVYGDANL